MSSFPGLSPTLAAAAAARRAEREKEVEAVRRRVRQTMPPVPELRFEVAYLKSILPAVVPKRRAVIEEEKDGSMRFDKPSNQETAVAIYNAEPVVVDWGRVLAVTIKDQIISPFLQGVFWGLLSVTLGSAATSLKGSLFGHRVEIKAPQVGDDGRDAAGFRAGGKVAAVKAVTDT